MPRCLGQEHEPHPVPVQPGQSYTFYQFTDWSDWSSAFSDDPNNPEPPTPDWHAVLNGSGGYVDVTSHPDSDGIVTGDLTMAFEWVLGEYTWEEVKDWDVQITVDAHYELTEFYALATGSADASVSVLEFHDEIGYVHGDPPGLKHVSGNISDTSNAFKKTIAEITTEDMIGSLLFRLYAHSHCTSIASDPNWGFASLALNSVTLELALPGDYNENDTVDAADYTVWRDNLVNNPSLDLPNEAATPRAVTEEDYDVWKAYFGWTAPDSGAATATLAAVPEPASTMLLALAALGAITLLRRRR